MTKTKVQHIIVSDDHAEQRIDNFLITFLKTMPKSHIYRLLRKGEIRVNKKRTKPEYRLKEGDDIRLPPMELAVKAPMAKPTDNLLAYLKTRILFEDDGLLIINKPSGLPVHGGTAVHMGVVEALRALYPKLELVHRLDLETSGCLILAKKRSRLRELHALMREGRVFKSYLTFTMGQWKPSEYRVTAPLLKNHLASGERIVKVNREGKASATVFDPVQSYKDGMLMEAILETGRTHQIRVHAQYKLHPVAGDKKYGDKEFNKKLRAVGLKRLFLHAHRLKFKLESGQSVNITCPLDAELEEVLARLKGH